MDAVATLAAGSRQVGPEATITLDLARRTNSVAVRRQTIIWPSSEAILDYDVAALNKSSFFRARVENAATRCAVWGLTIPHSGKSDHRRVGCCARAASGQATAPPPITLMKSRRLMLPPKAQDKAR